MKNRNSNYGICKRCIMDTTDPNITFDKNGFCNHCTSSINKIKKINLTPAEKDKRLRNLINEIKMKGKNKKYDCIIGISGGVDSTYVAYKAKEFGLRPLAIHLDNGWNSGIANTNIENISKKLKIDLKTYMVNWEEFKDLQLSFLKASVPDCEIPTDHAMMATLFRTAVEENINYILIGSNITTESIGVKAWSYGHFDSKYIKSIHSIFGLIPLKTYPYYTLFDLFKYIFIKRIKLIRLLDYIEYNKNEAILKLEDQLGWKYYGGKHYESIYTKFVQGHILPVKFGYDKRKAHLSSLICVGQISRKEALEEIKKPSYAQEDIKKDKDYIIRKLNLSEEEFDNIMKLPKKSFKDYPSYGKYINFEYLLNIYHYLFK